VPFTSLPFPPTNSSSTYKPLNIEIPRVAGFNRFNEACVDPTGKRWMLGAMMHEKNPSLSNGGALYSVEINGKNELKVSLKLDDVTIANGMGWSRDTKTM
jgi:sugar lactone lactonase YvrE